MALVVEYAIETGMRRGEIANQRRKHRKGNILLIPETKTDTPRTISLSKRTVKILEWLDEREDGYIWGYSPDMISSLFYKTCKELNVEDLRFHDLRHEAASRFIENGLSIPEVALITGQSFKILQRYTYLKAKDIADKLQ
jgi:integrase